MPSRALVASGAAVIVAGLVAVVVWQGLTIRHIQSQQKKDAGYTYALAEATTKIAKAIPEDQSSQISDMNSSVENLDGRVADLEKQLATLCQQLQGISWQVAGSSYACPA